MRSGNHGQNLASGVVDVLGMLAESVGQSLLNIVDSRLRETVTVIFRFAFLPCFDDDHDFCVFREQIVKRLDLSLR